MYGAFWCPHCEDQREAFGREAMADFPYVECFPDGLKPVCDPLAGFTRPKSSTTLNCVEFCCRMNGQASHLAEQHNES